MYLSGIRHISSCQRREHSLLLHIERHRWSFSRYFSIMSRLTNYFYTHIHAGLCLHIYITLNHFTGRRVYTSHCLLNISPHKLMSFVWPIDSSSSSMSHYAVSRLFLQTFRWINSAGHLFLFFLLVVSEVPFKNTCIVIMKWEYIVGFVI